MSRVLLLVMVTMCAVAKVSARTEDDLKRYLEGPAVSSTIDMPAAKDGVNVYPDGSQLIEALNRFVVFADGDENEKGNFQLRQISYTYNTPRVKHGVVYLGPPTTYLKEGLTTQEVLRFLGKPTTVSERSENGLVVTTYEFPRGENRVLVAEFVNGALVRSSIETRAPVQPGPRQPPKN